MAIPDQERDVMLAPVARARQLGRAMYDGLYCRHVAGKERLGGDDHWHVCLSALTPQSTVVLAQVFRPSWRWPGVSAVASSCSIPRRQRCALWA